MQTFLPSHDFNECARILDWRRLGRQRSEAKMILDGFLNPIKNGWKNHPASRMWTGYLPALAQYMNCVIKEWINRGYNNTMKLSDLPDKGVVVCPPWLGDEKYHSAYRAILLAKNYEYYSKFNWSETPNISVWPYPVPRLSRR